MSKKVNQRLLSRRYAEALFDVASASKQLKEVKSDLDALAKAVESSEALRKQLLNPAAKPSELSKSFSELAKKHRFVPTLDNFCQVLIQNGRVGIISAVSDAFDALVSQSNNEIKVGIVSAKKLGTDSKKALKEALKKAVDKKIELNEVVDPELIGGVVVKIGSQELDASVSGQLERMRVHLKQPTSKAS